MRILLVRDPSGRRKAEAFFSTDTRAAARFILETYAKRWTLEVAFHDCKQALGFEDPQNQAVDAVRRTAPVAAVVYALVLLWAAQHSQVQRQHIWVARPWYRRKTTPSFLDMLTTPRRESWRSSFVQPSSPHHDHQNAAPPWPEPRPLTA